MDQSVDKEDAKEEKKAMEIDEYLDYYKKFYEQKGKYNIYCITGESKEEKRTPGQLCGRIC